MLDQTSEVLDEINIESLPSEDARTNVENRKQEIKEIKEQLSNLGNSN